MFKNKSTKILIVVVLLLCVFYVGYYFGNKNEVADIEGINENTEEKQEVPVLINFKEIKEENFEGTVPEIVGENTVANEARTFVAKVVEEFRTQSNKDVPEMRKQFGQDNPSSNYSINIDAKYKKSSKTESIVLSIYTYTGGAHGTSSYKVFNTSNATGKELSLTDILQTGKEDAFVELIKRELYNWKSNDMDSSMFFTDAVEELNFEFFTNWSLDDENFVVYFNQYDIGPGVLGQIAFPIPLEKVKSFLNTEFK